MPKGICVGGPYDGRYIEEFKTFRVAENHQTPRVYSNAVAPTDTIAIDTMTYSYEMFCDVGFYVDTRLDWREVMTKLVTNYRPKVT